MSDAKATKKAKNAGKSTDKSKNAATKADAAKPDTGKSDTSTADSSAKKSEPAGKSKSQESISYFSSVSTPEYRAGWDHIFGPKKKSRK
ncbi:MAG: hypothetical protein AAGB04_11070 [Pseudomonadota bacterium]